MSRIASTPTLVAMLLVLACPLFVSGWLLHLPYEPTAEGAHRSMTEIYRSGFWGILARFHEFGSGVFLILACVTVAAMVLRQTFRDEPWLWYGAVVLLLAGMGLQITGHLLPFDRHAVQTAAIEGGIAARVPVVGDEARAIMLQGDTVGDATLGFWYLAHRWLLALALLGGMFAGWVGIRRSDETPAFVWCALPTALVLILSFWLTPGFGSAALEADRTGFDTRPNWYTWPLHGLLVFFDRFGLGWVGVALVPGLFATFLLSVPALAKRFTGTLIQAVFGVFVAGFVLAALGAGLPAPVFGNQDPPTVAVAPPKERLPIDPALVSKGRALFREVGCAGCHSIEGTGGSGGPPLDGVWQRYADPDWYVGFIRKPQSVRPSSTMPPFAGLTSEQLRALAEFLRKPRPVQP